MSADVCRIHGTPFREGKGGSRYCPNKVDGKWCSEKPGKAPSVPQERASAPTVTQNTSVTSKWDARVSAALAFSGQVFYGKGDVAALELADMALRLFDKYDS